jgi:catechol 2,3-dioxygenase-like lactoylglutathione lyase family enzyme
VAHWAPALSVGEGIVIDHTGVRVSDLAKSKAFYRAALAPIGYQLLVEFPAEVTGSDEVAAGAPNKPPVHVAFRVSERARVDAFHAAALTAGGRDNGAPGPRPHYHADYYGAFVLDPDGHNIEVVCREPAPLARGALR